MSREDFCNIKVSVPFRSTTHFRDIKAWCYENFDYHVYNIEGADYGNLNNRIFWFAHKHDAMLFALKWS